MGVGWRGLRVVEGELADGVGGGHGFCGGEGWICRLAMRSGLGGCSLWMESWWAYIMGLGYTLRGRVTHRHATSPVYAMINLRD